MGFGVKMGQLYVVSTDSVALACDRASVCLCNYTLNHKKRDVYF